MGWAGHPASSSWSTGTGLDQLRGANRGGVASCLVLSDIVHDIRSIGCFDSVEKVERQREGRVRALHVAGRARHSLFAVSERFCKP